mmetsp:Transcript_18590/g.58484  ORF Transcript_18590/g.58484 Transcript_18590/m.58484 type:complete len:80 (-) Transcript_18590:46-285(-)
MDNKLQVEDEIESILHGHHRAALPPLSNTNGRRRRRGRFAAQLAVPWNSRVRSKVAATRTSPPEQDAATYGSLLSAEAC